MSQASSTADHFDFIIVGAGAAGCVLANRLSADGKTRVCLLEAGPPDTSPWIHIPAGFIKLAYDPNWTWQIKTEPSANTNGRRIPTTGGKTLGGSSSINGFNCTRGQAEDYDGWAAMGNTGWSYAEVLPYFKRSERRIGHADPRWRGTEGPLPITDPDWHHPLCDAFIESAHAHGAPRGVDYNAACQEGTGYYQRWIERGRRRGAAQTFLKQARQRRNLDVRTRACATRLLFEDERVIGVEYRREGAPVLQRVHARREVIVSAGTVNTPKLLMLSGLGPEDQLREHAIPVRRCIEAVGRNLQDHHMLRSVCRVRGIDTLNQQARGWGRIGQIVRWALGRPSLMAISPSVAYAFMKSDPSQPRNNLQFHFSPGSYKEGVAGLLDDFPGMSLGFYNMRPRSAGRVWLASPDPAELPRVQPNYMDHAEDQRVLIDGLRLTRSLLHGAALLPYIERDEYPASDVQTDAELLTFARQRGGTAWHLIGTCRMGPEGDHNRVVDPQLRVVGVPGLRVIDASVMPSMPSGNTQIPTMMMAEKGADLLLGRAPPAAEYPHQAPGGHNHE